MSYVAGKDYDPQQLYQSMQSNLTYAKSEGVSDEEHGKKFYSKVMNWLEANAIKPTAEAISTNAAKIQAYLDNKAELVETDLKKAEKEMTSGSKKMSNRTKLIGVGIIAVLVYLLFFNKKS